MFQRTKKLLILVAPPILIDLLRKLKPQNQTADSSVQSPASSTYWTELENLLDDWGGTHVWNEIQLLLYDKQGKVLDIACGTGATMQRMSKYSELEITGIDINEQLIRSATEKGIGPERLFVADAKDLGRFSSHQFKYSYSIGVLYYFDDESLNQAISEIGRVTSDASFHFILTSSNDLDEGEIMTWQRFRNNSAAWWRSKMLQTFSRVTVIESGWQDTQFKKSKGTWMICSSDPGALGN
jgi:ubiquinone/menaquinone biosynthesis C-methylase UbiE